MTEFLVRTCSQRGLTARAVAPFLSRRERVAMPRRAALFGGTALGGLAASLLASATLLASAPASAADACLDNPYNSTGTLSGTCDLGPAIFVVGTGTLTIQGGGSLISGQANIGLGSDGTVTVTGTDGSGNASTWTSTKTFIVGYSGKGTLTVSDGGAVSNQGGILGFTASSEGTVTVTGTGSTWTNTAALIVGYDGKGTLTVSDGGAVSNKFAYIGLSTGSEGTVTVTGTGSTWTNPDSLIVGSVGKGTLTVSDGGAVSNKGGTIGYYAGSEGTVTVTGTGSTWTNTDDLDVGLVGKGTLTVSDGGKVSVGNELGAVTLASDTSGAGTLNIGAGANAAAAAPGTLDVKEIAFQQGTGTLVFNHTGSDYSFAPSLTGGHLDSATATIEQVAGTTILTAGSPAYGGATKVSGGTLLVNGTLGSSVSSVSVAGGTLGGSGTIGGDVTVQSGGILSPGTSPATLTVNGDLTLASGSTSVFELNTPEVRGGDTNDFVSVGGNLTLGGTLKAQVGSAGYYNLFDYGDTLSGSFATTSVTGVSGASGTIDTSKKGKVNLTVKSGGGRQSIQFWDGANTSANSTVDGGTGTWDGTTTNWTTSNGSANSAWDNAVGVFTGSAGTVTVSGTQGFSTLQFKTDGYAVKGGTLTISPALGGLGYINVDDGVSATIASTIADGTGSKLKKVGGGTLTLTGANTYTGGMQVIRGRLVGNTGSIRGDIANGGTVEFAQSDDGTFAGAIGGFNSTNGQMVKSGAGTLTLTGANSLDWSIEQGSVISTTALFTGNVMVAAGTDLTFDQAFDGSYGGVVSGAGDILYTGGGLVTLTGDNSGYAGKTTVRGFTLKLGDNTIGGNLVLGSGGRLAGNGTVGATVVQSGGTIAPGNSPGTVNVAGDLTFMAGSTYEVETQPMSTVSDLIAVSGTATLAGDVLHIGFDGNYAPTSTYTILTADGGINGTFESVSSTLAFLDPTLLYGANAVDLQLVRNDVGFVDLAQTANQRASATGIESLGMGNAVYDAVVALDGASAPAAFDALSGEIHASLKTGLIGDSRYVRDAAQARARTASGMSCLSPDGTALAGDACTGDMASARYGAWMQAFGSFGSIDGDGNAAKLDTDTGGFMIGGDTAIGDAGLAGVLAGYQSSRYSVDGRASNADASSFFLGVYGGTEFNGFNLSGGAAYAWSDIDTSRSVAFPGYSDYLTGSTNAGTAQVFGELGYEFDMGDAILEPFAGLAYVSVSTDGYAESGGASALSVASDTSDVTYSTLGVRGSAALPFDATTSARLTGMLGWRHAYGSLTPTAQNAFAGGSAFTVSGVPVGEDVAVVSAGLAFDLGSRPEMGISDATFSISYDGQFGSGVVDNAATARLSFKF